MKNQYVLAEDYDYQLKGYTFNNDIVFKDKSGISWGVLRRSGLLTVLKGYTFDGATGVGDGKIQENGLPQLYYPSLVHDVLYQFFKQHPLTRKQVDDIFYQMMVESGFKNAKLYRFGLKLFGGIFLKLKGNNKE